MKCNFKVYFLIANICRLHPLTEAGQWGVNSASMQGVNVHLKLEYLRADIVSVKVPLLLCDDVMMLGYVWPHI